MRRQQLIILVAALASVTLLFSLPKVLLNKEEKELLNSAELEKSEPSHEQTEAVETTSKLVGTEISLVLRLRKKAANASTFSIKLAALDSMSTVYNSKGYYDSSAFYCEELLSGTKTEESFIAIGDACYKAYYFTDNEKQSEIWAGKTQGYYQKALNQNPSLLDVKAKLAMTYTKSKNPMQAVMTLREVLEKDPNNEQALLNIGLLSVQSGQFEKAAERFKKLLSLNPQNWLGTFYLGIAYAELGNKAEALKCFEKVKKNEKQPQILQAAEEYLKQLSNH
jgi:outer membrane protein